MPNNDRPRQLIEDALRVANAAAVPVRGARFKAKYLRDLDPAFDEKQLGYRNLRAFLEAYPDIVRVDHDGLDIVVRPAEHATHGPSKELQSIRADIWRAFTLADKSVLRYYNTDLNEAILLPAEKADDEPERLKAARQRLMQHPHAFVPIAPVTSTQQLEQMRAFVASVADTRMRRRLELSLGNTLWFREFMASLSSQQQLLQIWRVQWSEFVLARIREWMEAHDVEVPNLVTKTILVSVSAEPSPSPAAPARPSEKRPASESPRPSEKRRASDSPSTRLELDVEDVRARIIHAVERMSIAQLLSLPIPTEYLLRR